MSTSVDTDNPVDTCRSCRHKTPLWKILLEFGMFFATAGAFGATLYYAWTAHEQLEGDRPWLGASLNVEHVAVGEQATAQLIFNNSGRSPARVTNTNIHAGCFAKFPDPEKVYAKGGVHGMTIIIPGGMVVTAKRPLLGSEDHWVDPTITQEAIQKLFLSKDCGFYIFGKVEYSSMNENKKWWTHACYVFLQNGFANCPDYNDAR